MKLRIAIGLFIVLIVGPLRAAGPYSFTGVGLCSMCHRGEANHLIFEKWLASKHAGAFKRLDPTKGEDRNPGCVGCHTTGFGAGGYEIGAANAAKFEGVQCEACHGAGSAYKAVAVMKDRTLAQQNGLIVPTEGTCKTCHRSASPTFKGFDFTLALKMIDHRYRK